MAVENRKRSRSSTPKYKVYGIRERPYVEKITRWDRRSNKKHLIGVGLAFLR